MTQDDVRARVTRSQHTIHNPDDPRHFMRIKPAGRHVLVTLDGEVLAQSDRALRVIEAGNDLYDPVVYFPRADVCARLVPAARERTWCPLKGHASYFDLAARAGGAAVIEIAWTYDETLDFADELKDLVGFYADKVVIEERPVAAAA